MGDDAGDSLTASGKFLQELGGPAAAITFENRSNDTHDSAVNMAAMARARGWKRLVLVTDATHMRRTRAAFVHEGMTVSCEPTMMWRIGGDAPRIGWPSWAPSSTNTGDCCTTAREAGFEVQWAFGVAVPDRRGFPHFSRLSGRGSAW